MTRSSAEDKLVEAARRHRPALAERASAVEENRQADEEAVSALASDGFFRMLVPREHGGLEVAPTTFVEVLSELARGDAATAWCVMTGATTGVLSAYMSKRGADELWADNPQAVMAGVFAPVGRARRTAEGYRVSGRWPFASGCQHAGVCSGGAVVVDESGAPETDDQGKVQLISVFMPRSSLEIHDTWHTSGLRGTGSHDIEADDVVVPEHHTARIVNAEPRARGPLFAFPPFGLLASGVAAVSIGLGHAALESIAALAKQKKPAGSRRPLAERELVQIEFSSASGELDAGSALLRMTLADIYAEACSTGRINLEARARVRLAACQAVRAATRAVSTAYKLGGGTSLYERHPLQRHFRDVFTVTQHIMVSSSAEQLVGRALLGVDGDFAQL